MLPLLILVALGGNFLLAGCTIIAIKGIKEFYSGLESMGVKPWKSLGFASALILPVLSLISKQPFDMLLAWLVCMIMMSAIYMFKIDERNVEDSMATAFGIIYVVFFSYHVYLVDNAMHKLVWLIFIAAFGSDIFAYFTGYFLGKHKLAPALSPKKTVEGAIGGIMGSGICALAFGLIFVPEYVIHCVILGLVCSPISMAGDLVASAFKRKMGIKDYGNLIPGHGGIMDRFDSVLFVAPVVFYYIHFFIL